MKIQMTLMVFCEGTKQGEFDVIAEYPDAIAALNAVAQIGAVNSTLSSHPDVRALLEGVGPNSLARIHESMGAGTVVQIKKIVEFREEMPEELRTNPHAFHIIASRPKREIPSEGIVTPVQTGQIH